MEITAADREEFRFFTESAIRGIKLVRSLPTDYLLQARVVGPELTELQHAVGPGTNPNWCIAQVALELHFNRGAISLDEFDGLTR